MMANRESPTPPRRIEVVRVIDVSFLLREAAEMIWQSRETSGAPSSYGRVATDLRTVAAEMERDE